jgi:hypothetical protein
VPTRADSDRPSGRVIGNALLLVALLLAASAAEGAPGPSGSCRATAAGRRVLVQVKLDDLFAPELLRLVSLGLDGRITVEVDLVRRRPLWFSQRVARTSLELTVSRDASGDGFLLDGERPLLDPRRLYLERLALPYEGDDPARYQAEVRVQLRVITPGSLGKMAAWVAGGEGKSEERSALSAGVLAMLADELSRTLELQCAVRPR